MFELAGDDACRRSKREAERASSLYALSGASPFKIVRQLTKLLRPDLALALALDTLRRSSDAMPTVVRTQLADVTLPLFGLAYMLVVSDPFEVRDEQARVLAAMGGDGGGGGGGGDEKDEEDDGTGAPQAASAEAARAVVSVVGQTVLASAALLKHLRHFLKVRGMLSLLRVLLPLTCSDVSLCPLCPQTNKDYTYERAIEHLVALGFVYVNTRRMCVCVCVYACSPSPPSPHHTGAYSALPHDRHEALLVGHARACMSSVLTKVHHGGAAALLDKTCIAFLCKTYAHHTGNTRTACPFES